MNNPPKESPDSPPSHAPNIRFSAGQDGFYALLEAAPDAILIVDKARCIVALNQQAERLFGYPRDELLAQPLERLVSASAMPQQGQHLHDFCADPPSHPMESGTTLTARRKDGSPVPVEISLSPLQTVDGVLAIAAIRDASSRNLVQESLSRLNQELQEHAVKHESANEELETALEELRVTNEDLAQQIDQRKQMEDILRVNEERFRFVLANSPVVVATLDRDLRYTWIYNPVPGFNSRDVLGETVGMSLSPQSRQEILALLKNVVSSGIPISHEVVSKTRSGDRILETHAEPLKDSRGEITGIAMLSMDITERKVAVDEIRRLNAELEQRVDALEQANTELRTEIERRRAVEAALKEAEQEANDLVRFAPTAIYEIDFRGPRFTSVNDAMCQMSGYTRDELLAISPFELMDADSGRRFKERMSKALAGQPVDESVEYKARHKDGRMMYVILKTRPLYEQGRPVGAFVIAHDVTERKQAEEALLDTQTRLQALVETTSDYIWEMDARGRYTYCSPQLRTLWGFDPQEMIDKSPFDLLPPEDRKQAVAVFSELTASRSPFRNMQVRSYDAQGDVKILEISGVPFFDAAGELRGYRGITRDITERKQAEEALQTNRELLETVVYHMPAAVNIVRGSDLTLQLVNSAYQAIAPGKDMVGKTLDELWPETGQSFGRICRQVLETGEPYRAEDELNMIRRRPDGPLEPAYFTWSLHRVRLPGDQGWGLLNAAWETTARKHIETQLKEIAQKYSVLFDTTSDGVWIHDLTGKIVEANDAYCRMSGYTREELTGMSVSTLEAVESSRDVSKHIQRVVDSGGHDRFESRHRRKDGSVFDVDITALYLEREGGQIAIFVRDITERKRAEEELRRRTEELQAVMEAVPTAVFITRDPQARVITGNRAARALVETPPSANISKTAPEEERPTGWQEMHNGVPIPPQDLPLQQAARGIEVRDYEMDLVFQEGNVKSVVGYATPLRDPHGSPQGGIAVLVDMTQRKRSEEALQESETKYRNLFMNMTEEVHFWKLVRDAEGRIQTWRLVDANPPALKSWARPSILDIKGKSTDEIFGPGSTEHYMPVVNKIMTEGIPYAYEDYFPNLDKYFRFTSVPLGEYFITTGSDITGIKKSEQALREAAQRNQILNRDLEQRAGELQIANEELERLATSLALDLRSPLVSLRGVSRVLAQDYGPQLPPQAQELFQLIQGNADEMEELTQGLLRLMRVARQALRKQDLQPDEIVRAALIDLKSEREAHPMEITLEPLPACSGDPLLLKQVWTTLLSNAFQATRIRDHGQIHIGARTEGKRTVYFVRDNGVGFDMSYAGMIFRAFQRYHRPEEWQGSGVGLAIVESIIRRHGGRVWAEGAVNEGATFFFEL